MTELTLRLNDDLVHRAKAYAARSGKSLADLVAGYFASLATDSSAPAAEIAAEPSEPLSARQYQLAGQYPGEYVVLVGERVLHHSTDRREAGRAYNRVFLDYPTATPVMVDPERPRHPRPKPIVRGRTFHRRWQA